MENRENVTKEIERDRIFCTKIGVEGCKFGKDVAVLFKFDGFDHTKATRNLGVIVAGENIRAFANMVNKLADIYDTAHRNKK